MNKWDRDFFNGKCPYTEDPCEKDIDCVDCKVNEMEKREAEKMDNAEYKEWFEGKAGK